MKILILLSVIYFMQTVFVWFQMGAAIETKREFWINLIPFIFVYAFIKNFIFMTIDAYNKLD